MGRAFTCDKCGEFMKEPFFAEEHIIDKNEEGQTTSVKIDIMKPNHYDLCPMCALKAAVKGINEEAKKRGGEIVLKFKEKEVEPKVSLSGTQTGRIIGKKSNILEKERKLKT